MKPSRRSLALTCVLTLSACAPSSATSTAPPQTWPQPQQAAAKGPVDDVAARLTTWLRLVGPNASTIPARDYANFLTTRPVWPRWAVIRARYEHALVNEPDDSVAADLCRAEPPKTAPALLRCVSIAGGMDAFREAGRAAWRNGNDGPQDAAAVKDTFGPALTADDNWARFQREIRNGHLTAAAATMSSLDPDRAALAQAELAFRRNDSTAESLLAAVPERYADDSSLILAHARWLAKNQRLDDALALWKQRGFDAESRAAPAEQGHFWRERDALARALLAQNRPGDALTMANDPTHIEGRQRSDSAFLSGWIALRALHDPQQADSFFRELAASPSLNTHAGGFYWLGRARLEANDMAAARADWQQAALQPQTFYGQMALARLSDSGNALLAPARVPDALQSAIRQWFAAEAHNEHDPTAVSVRLDGSDLARAAQILVSWNDRTHARDFLRVLFVQDTDPQDREALAVLAQRVGLPDIGVSVARAASRTGTALPDYGWPAPYRPPGSTLPDGLVPSLMRQESNFDPDAVSPSNAIGLMQLLPATAQETAHSIGLGPVSIAALHDPGLNMQLGTAYLSKVATRFDGVVPYAAAGYNAGPHRVSQWLEERGDPARTGADQDTLIDWIEQIPTEETRNYVKRVWEGIAVYASRPKG
ncbi:transglycosylase SLT domain-containing protein [Acetobacter estunensis]|uniref:Transglycosylase SLT domain-containing protein n=1 Tax=Acetobacter estunensis TaxID=104097 RepID=A0A967ED46_9PROT|nr:lytic transglycosylase domain-containing protein [Acetobacter estunensis]NHO53931.1 transglycosylase SLT domain-containing protein [Acetobacter estunensis]